MLKVYPLNGGRMLRDGAEALVRNHAVHGGGSSLKLSVLVERDEDGYYVGSVPELPGCHTQVRTLDDLLRRIREAMELYLEAEGIAPTVVVAELCAGCYEFNQLKEKDEFLTQLANPNCEIIDLDLRIANEAGRIRAATGLHLPDAIIVASSPAASSSIIAIHDIELTKARSLISVLSAEQVLKQLSSSPE